MRTGMRTRSIGTAAVSVLASVAGLVALTGCGLQDQRDAVGAGGSSPSAVPSVAPKAPVPSGKPLGTDAHVPKPTGVDETDASALVKAWAEVAYGYDTKYDTSPQDAMVRSARWFTPTKAAAERSYKYGSGPGDAWNTWAEHKAWTTPDVHHDDDIDDPRDTREKAFRTLYIEGTAQGRDGWTGTGPQLTAFIKLVRSGPGKPWRINEITAVEAAIPPSASASPATSSPSSSDRPV